MSDWKNGFGAATGSTIVRIRQFSSENIRRMFYMTRFVDSISVSGAASVVFLLVSYNPWNLFQLPPCWQRLFRRISLDLRTYLMEIFRSIQFTIYSMEWRDMRLFGGFLSAVIACTYQAINLYRWHFYGIETAVFHSRIGYVSIIVLELSFYRTGRFRRMSRRDYFMTTFLSLMNIPGILIYRNDHIWDRTCYLFSMSSIFMMFRRYFDMIHVFDTVERLVLELDQTPTVIRRLSTVDGTEDENNEEQDDGPTVADRESENNEQDDGPNVVDAENSKKTDDKNVDEKLSLGSRSDN